MYSNPTYMYYMHSDSFLVGACLGGAGTGTGSIWMVVLHAASLSLANNNLLVSYSTYIINGYHYCFLLILQK
jgi:hypothetical protein